MLSVNAWYRLTVTESEVLTLISVYEVILNCLSVLVSAGEMLQSWARSESC